MITSNFDPGIHSDSLAIVFNYLIRVFFSFIWQIIFFFQNTHTITTRTNHIKRSFFKKFIVFSADL